VLPGILPAAEASSVANEWVLMEIDAPVPSPARLEVQEALLRTLVDDLAQDDLKGNHVPIQSFLPGPAQVGTARQDLDQSPSGHERN
jgi:hypothetical protein